MGEWDYPCIRPTPHPTALACRVGCAALGQGVHSRSSFPPPPLPLTQGGTGGGFCGGTISLENFVFKEGGEIFPWRILGVSASAGAHVRGPAGLPAQGRLGRVGGGGSLRPWPYLALLECCLGGRTVRPHGGAPVPHSAAGDRRHGLRWGLPMYHAPVCPLLWGRRLEQRILLNVVK